MYAHIVMCVYMCLGIHPLLIEQIEELFLQINICTVKNNIHKTVPAKY